MAPPIQTAWQCTIWKALQFRSCQACMLKAARWQQATSHSMRHAVSKATVRPDSKNNRNSCRSSPFACSSLAPPGTIERAVEICQNTFAAHLPPAVISKQSAQTHMLHSSIQCATQGATQCDTFHADSNPTIPQQHDIYQSEQWRSITADWCLAQSFTTNACQKWARASSYFHLLLKVQALAVALINIL